MISMDEIRISNVPNMLIISNNRRITLPSSIRKKIDRHWEDLTASNPYLRNGEVFTVTEVKENEGRTVITLAETDYAHYLYSQQVGGLGRYAVRIIHPTALVVSKDRMFILGSMGQHTSRPGVIQCCGGGLDCGDIKGGVVDVDHCIRKELLEELGIDTEKSREASLCI